MPKDPSIRKVLVIGSGPIVIGQAAEFDYAGAQACRVLKEEGVNVVLVNSNPATIMTDRRMADEIYLEPLCAKTVERIIEKERPDSLLAGLGGQNGLTIATQLAKSGVLKKYGVRLLGTSAEAIARAEDRELFRETMERLGQPVVPSEIRARRGSADRLPRHRPSGVHARRLRRRHRRNRGGAARHREKRSVPVPNRADPHRALHRRLEGD